MFFPFSIVYLGVIFCSFSFVGSQSKTESSEERRVNALEDRMKFALVYTKAELNTAASIRQVGLRVLEQGCIRSNKQKAPRKNTSRIIFPGISREGSGSLGFLSFYIYSRSLALLKPSKMCDMPSQCSTALLIAPRYFANGIYKIFDCTLYY